MQAYVKGRAPAPAAQRRCRTAGVGGAGARRRPPPRPAHARTRPLQRPLGATADGDSPPGQQQQQQQQQQPTVLPPGSADPYAAAAAALAGADGAPAAAAAAAAAGPGPEANSKEATIDADFDAAAEAASEAAAAAGPAGVAALGGAPALDASAHARAPPTAEAAAAAAAAAEGGAKEGVGAEGVLPRITSLAIPLMIQNLAGYSVSIIGAVFIGRLGPLLLSSSFLANSFYNATGLSIAMGLSAGLETMCGQAYGAGDYKALGLLLQRALLICCAACVPVGALWLGSESLLVAMGQEPAIAAAASRYLILCIPCLFLSISCECLRKYLQSQREAKPAAIMAAAATAAAPFLFYALVNRAGFGLDGAAMAFVACQAITLAGLVAFVAARARKMEGHPQQTWGGFSKEAFKGWGEYLHYGVPAAAHICCEWWALEVVILWAGLLPDAALSLSTMGLCFSINAYLYMLPLGLASSINTNVANALGGGDGERARAAGRWGLALAAGLQAVLAGALLLGGRHVLSLFCPDPAVIARCLGVLPALSCLVVLDGVNAALSGVLRGSGRQKLGAAVNFVGFWIVGLPLSWALAFPGGLGEWGLWAGVCAGAGVQAAVLLTLLSRWDWAAEAARVRRRIAEAAARKGDAPPGLAPAH
ncbi:hypothetical protein Rsub_10417 [Raphidocelis subcapitata]|uniref:Protein DETOXIFICATION n=1 Tax=Raphidocelis subcapitata TaxID=307507 RepID=A0A2V0PCB7_9CHLO|nr:hypothetical protein Rsub_10417 [Raphidocelis subcapitata]|eukprot:GBF97494.1 hypothetical protein Rsub_10417 [Raphidocelis subcapitata]